MSAHNFQPGMFLGDLPMAWCQCGYWTQVRPSEFKHLFGKSFRRFKSEYRKSNYLGKGVWKVDMPQMTIGSCGKPGYGQLTITAEAAEILGKQDIE